MPATSGPGNARWSREETVLALDLLLNCYRNKVPDKKHGEVIELSRILRGLRIHPQHARKPSFRNPDSIVFKLQNLRIAGGGQGGLRHISKRDRDVSAEFRHDRAGLRHLALAIRKAAHELATSAHDPEYDPQYELAEGRLLTRLHMLRERDKSARTRVLRRVRYEHCGSLCCEGCGVGPRVRNGGAAIEEAEFEIHHLLPLSQLIGSKTMSTDLVLLCACCHRLIHALSRQAGKNVSLGNLRKELSN
jgi:5-methylcytosine-specific restriction enzyme A